MKHLNAFLETIRSLPEEARRALAVSSFIVASLAVFAGWSFLIPQRLYSLGAEDIKQAEAQPSAPTSTEQQGAVVPDTSAVLTPAEGITESFRALQLGAVAQNGLSSAASALKIAWRYVYDPLK